MCIRDRYDCCFKKPIRTLSVLKITTYGTTYLQLGVRLRCRAMQSSAECWQLIDQWRSRWMPSAASNVWSSVQGKHCTSDSSEECRRAALSRLEISGPCGSPSSQTSESPDFCNKHQTNTVHFWNFSNSSMVSYAKWSLHHCHNYSDVAGVLFLYRLHASIRDCK